MEHGSQMDSDALVSEQAASWFVRVVANDLSARERSEYLAWLKTSGRHVEALLDIYRYHGYGRKAKLNMGSSPDSDPGANIIQFTPRGTGVLQQQDREVRRRRRRYAKIAAAITGLAILLSGGWAAKAYYFDDRISTSAGEWTQEMLADGSILRIGPNTQLHWSFDEGRRLIELSRGEAVFEVAKDPRRPFVVSTEVGDVRAIGTEFGVSLMNVSTAVVTVAHGKVAVSRPGNGLMIIEDKSVAVAELVADQQIVMSAVGSHQVEKVDASRELQWATGYYEFRGETVGQAVEQFNRRNKLQVVMADPGIAEIAMPFTTVKLDDPATFAVMLAARPDVQVAYESANVIRLLRE
jgi:transmembrane sensor